MKLKDLYEHTPEQIITAKKNYVKHIIRKEKIASPKWMARNWKYDGGCYEFMGSTNTKLPDVFSSPKIWYVPQNQVKITLTVINYSKKVRQILYISRLYQEIFGKTLEKQKISAWVNDTVFINDPDLLTPELKNAIQTKKLNIMDIVTFQALHEIAKEQEAIK
jgi:hypothetical protein